MKPFSIYFPQFYPIQTNDLAWGSGFTDWTLVANANLNNSWVRRAPLKGFYDGSDASIHCSQIEEMIAGGLGGIALYHYWFFTHQELSAFEFGLVNRRNQTKIPWFLIWANESWTRRWKRDSTQILNLSKNPSISEIEAHCRYLLRCFDDPSYFLFNGKPLFVWYNLNHFDRPQVVIDQYRHCFLGHGVEISTGQFIKNPFESIFSSFTDVNYLFEPRLFFGSIRAGRGQVAKKILDMSKKVFGNNSADFLLSIADLIQQNGNIYDADKFFNYYKGDIRNKFLSTLSGSVQEVLSPGWNNTPRYSSRFTALQNIDPIQFANLVLTASESNRAVPPLINAWNEWSEGAAIEPCAYFGSSYLDALSMNGYAL